MADNTELNAGTGGDTIASDDIGGIKHQRVKVEHGADGSATDVSAASPMPVEIGDGTDQALVSAGGALLTDASATTQPVSAASLPLPSGAATAAAQLADGHNVTVDNASVPIANNDTVSTNNSSTSTLIADAVFTGTGDDILGYSSVTIQVDASHDSAVDGLLFEFSIDDTNWDDMVAFNYTAADGARRFQFPATARYFRVVYTNGGTGQTHFRLQTILHRQAVRTTVHRVVDDIDPDRSAELVKAVLIAQAAGSGDFVPIDATAGGNLRVSVEEINGSAIMPVEGPDAENAAVTGNPLLSGGRFDSSPRTLGDGDVGAIALDADGAVQVSDGGNALTIDGTVTEANSAAILVDTGVLAGAVAGTEVQVDIVSDGAGLALAANQLADGHNVTVDNAVGSPVQVEIGDGVDTALVSAAGALVTDGSGVTQPVSNGGTFATQAAATLQAGSALAGDVGISGARTSGGTTLYKNIDVDESEDAVKASAGQVYWIHAINLATTPRYLKIYNATVASVTVGTTVPDLTFPIPSQGDANGAGFTLAIPNGIAFGTAITIAATTGVADNDSGAPGANEVIVNLGYA